MSESSKFPAGVRTTLPGQKPKDVPPLVTPMEPPEGFHRVEEAPLGAWEEPGMTVAGYIVGFRDSGKYAGRQLVDLRNDDGEVFTYPAPVMLLARLRSLPPGTAVVIQYLGEKPTDKGSTKMFEVFANNLA